jgi:chromosome segregation ATPase/CheY-like chemotaxis protein
LELALSEAATALREQNGACDALHAELAARTAEYESVAAALAALRDESGERGQALARQSTELAALQARADTDAAALHDALAALDERGATCARLESELAAQAAAHASLAGERAALAASLDEARRQLDEQQTQLAAELAEREALVAARTTAGEAFEALRLRSEADASALHEALAALEERRATCARLEGELAAQFAAHASLSDQQSALSAALEAARAELSEERGRLAAALAERDDALAERDAALGSAQAGVEALQAELGRRADAAAELAAALLEAERLAGERGQALEAAELARRDQEATAQALLDEALSDGAAARQRAEALAAELAAATERQQRVEREGQDLQARCTSLTARLGESEQTRRGLEADCAAAVERAAAAERAHRAADAALERTRTSAGGLNASLDEARNALADSQAAHAELAAQHDLLVSRVAELEHDRQRLVEEAAAAAEAFAGRERDLTDMLAGLRDELAAATAALADHSTSASARDEVERCLHEERSAHEALRAAHDLERATRAALADELSAASRDRERAEAEVAALRERLPDAEELEIWRTRGAELEAERNHLLEERAELRERLERLEHGMLAARETEERLLADAQRRNESLTSGQTELARVSAARERLTEELTLAQQQLDASRIICEQLEARVAAAERGTEQSHEREQRVHQQALDLQEQLLDDEGRLAAMAVERDQAQRERAALEARLEAERAAHAETLAQLTARAEAAQREQANAEASDRGQRDGLARMQARVEDLERQQSEAAHRHSQAVSLYMLELNQRSEALRQRDLEVQRLEEQLRLVEQACEDGTAQIASLRHEKDALEQQIANTPAAGGDGLRLVGDDAERLMRDLGERVGREERAEPAPRRARTEPPRLEPPRSEPAAADLRLVEKNAQLAGFDADAGCLVVHAEDHAALREALRLEVERCNGASYASAAESPSDCAGRLPLVAVNLLAKEVDPLATICDPRWQRGGSRAFTYLAAGSRGIIAGVTDFIPHPFEPDECATRLLERPGGTQRVLMVSDKIEVMNEIRAVLNRVRCSTSLALDGRQAYDLVGMVKPDAILIDLTLPRGEGLRLVGRLRADAKTANIAIIFALGEPLDVGRFRADAARVLSDCRFSPEDLTAAFGQVLGTWRNDEMRAAG